MGIYTELLRGLPKFSDGDASFAERVNNFRLTLGPQTPATAAAGYRKVRDVKEELDTKLEELRVAVAAWEACLHESYENAGITSLKLADGSSISTYVEPYAQVKDPVAFHEWCLENDLGNKMSLSWMTTNSIAKERLKDKEPPPPGVEIFVKTKTRLNR